MIRESEWPGSDAGSELRPARLIWLAALVLASVAVGSGCKLVELKMPGDPMPKQDFALRGQTREFAAVVSATVQQVADSIARHTDDATIKVHCAQWKIGAVSAIRSATLRSAPKLALLDAWAFCRQMDDYLEKGPGAHLFGAFQSMAVTNSQALERRLSATARTLLSKAEFSQMEKFLDSYVTEFPFQTISFEREPVAARWEDFEGKPTQIPPAGTTSEALSDVAERMQMLGQQVPDEVRWRLTLEADEMETQLARTGVTLDRLDLALKSIATAAESSPATMTNAVQDLRAAFLPVLERFQNQWDETTRTVQTERRALTETFTNQSAVLLKAVDEQRSAIMRETQEMAKELADRSLTELHGVIRDVLFYAVLLVGIVLGLPFLIGFLLGRAWSRARGGKAAPTPSETPVNH